MFDLKEFRRVNNLTQAAVADYLCVSEPFISRVETGKDPLPQDKLDKLIHNDQGWTVPTAQASGVRFRIELPQKKKFSDYSINTSSTPSIPNRSESNETWEQKKIHMLEQRVAQLEQQNSEYWELIKKLTDR